MKKYAVLLVLGFSISMFLLTGCSSVKDMSCDDPTVTKTVVSLYKQLFKNMMLSSVYSNNLGTRTDSVLKPYIDNKVDEMLSGFEFSLRDIQTLQTTDNSVICSGVIYDKNSKMSTLTYRLYVKNGSPYVNIETIN